jgi:carboxymethylenebutenolidase
MFETISFSVGEQAHQAALAVPATGEPPFPAVVVIHDIYGFSDDLRRHCQRFGDAGYVALGPDLYRGGRLGCVVNTLTSMVTGKGFAYDVIDAARRALEARHDVDAKRIGVAGFCMGGSFALLAAADQSFAVAAPFYGAVPARASRLRGLCPTIAQYGALDSVFLSHAKRLSHHLEELGIDHEVHIYDHAGHSFMNQIEGALAPLGRHTPLRASYDPVTEALAWDRLLDFFARHVSTSR